MQRLFPGFYAPTEQSLETLWSDGVFVLDSSVLLKLYEVPEQTRQETFAALRKLGNRLWVPHQAALEYQRNRAKTIGMARSRVEQALDPMTSALQGFLRAAEALKLAERGHSDAAARLAEIRSGGDEVMAAARAAIANHVDINGEDPIRTELDALLAGKVGVAPTAEQLSEWSKDAVHRYGHRMGPGHQDQEKMKHPTYMMDGLVFDKRYGDLYIWMQTVGHASSAGIRNLVLITNDRKGDWWKVTDHGIAGPLPEICSEIRAEGGVENFWMYDLETFLREAEQRLDVSVSKTTLSDVSIPTEFLIDFVDSAKQVQFRRRIEIASPYQPDAEAGVHMTLAARRIARRNAMLSDNGFHVMEADSIVAVGYKTVGDEAVVGAAILEHQLGDAEASEVLREELASMRVLLSARRFEIFVGAQTILGAVNDRKVARWVGRQVGMMEVDAAVIEVYYGAAGKFKLIETLAT